MTNDAYRELTAALIRIADAADRIANSLDAVKRDEAGAILVVTKPYPMSKMPAASSPKPSM